MDIIKPLCSGFYNDINVLGDLMKNFKYYAQSYVDLVIRLWRLRFSLFVVMILAVLAFCLRFCLVYLLFVRYLVFLFIRWITFGLLVLIFLSSVILLELCIVERTCTFSVFDFPEHWLFCWKNSVIASSLLATISHDLSHAVEWVCRA